MCIKAGALASCRHLRSLKRVTPAGLSSSTYISARSSVSFSFSSIWRVIDLSQKRKKDGFERPSQNPDDSSKIASTPGSPRSLGGFSSLFYARAMSTASDFNAPIDRQRFHLQFVTTPTADTQGTTLLLHFSSKRYLFGRVAEGTQRACTERGIALKKTRSIFLTGETKWAHNSGLLGMILTMADFKVETDEEEQAGLGQIRIHGGPKIWHSIACARRFIFRTGMPLRVFEAQPDAWKPAQQPDFVDENILLWAVPVQRKTRRTSTVPIPDDRASDPVILEQEQSLRQKTVHDMFDSDWRKDKLSEVVFQEVNLPAMVWVRDPESKSLQATFCTKMADAPHIRPDQKVLVRMPWPAALVAELPPADNLPSSVSMSYIVKGRPQRGVFVPQRAKALGVKQGPLFGLLATGQSVQAEDGRTVKAEDVMDPVSPGQGVAILDAPDVHYLPDLLHKLSALQDGQLSDLHAFIWILGPGVFDSPEFLEFKAHFPQMKHIVSSVDNCSNYLAMASSAASAARLNQIRPDIFAIPRHDNTLPQTVDTNGNMVRAERGMVLDLAPKFDINVNEVPKPLDIENIVQAVSSSTKALLPQNNDVQDPEDHKHKDVTITTLGTGSAVPSKYRNVSANLLHIPSLGYFIFDAGENTLGQLRRLYGPEELEDILCNLHLVWISHLHADHHLGTVSLLVARKDAVCKRRAAGHHVAHNLYLVSERNMADYLEDYKSVEVNDAVTLHCLNSDLTDVTGNPTNVHQTTMPVSQLKTTRVSHCHGAQAISITFKNGFKLSYSGDCRPSASFAEIGQDSDVLIHEATFDDGMEGDAMAKKHCTIGEALGVAHAMKAKNVILTHFSQRYQKLPTLKDVRVPGQLSFEEGDDVKDLTGPLEEADGENHVSAVASNGTTSGSRIADPGTTNGAHPPEFNRHTSLQEVAQKMSVCVAFDLMRVTIPQIKDMYKYYPAIEEMFEIEQQKSDSRRETLRLANEAMNHAKEEKAQAKRNATLKKKSKKDKANGANPTERTKEKNKNSVPPLAEAEHTQHAVETSINTEAPSRGLEPSDNKPSEVNKQRQHDRKRRKLTNDLT